MNGIAGYILSVTAAAIVTAILLNLAGQESAGRVVRLLSGIFMTLTVASPLVKLELPDPEGWISGYARSGQAAAAMGEELADEAAHVFIKSRMESYILDKAAVLGADLSADVILDEEGLPISVTLTGAAAPHVRSRLTRIIEADLGIGEEAQYWSD